MVVLLLSFFICMVAYHAIRYPILLAGGESKRTAPKYEKTALPDARLQSERFANYAILAIALDVGFSIKASFNRV